MAEISVRQRPNRVDPTAGPIVRALVRLSWPIMTGSMAMVIHQLVNTLWLGRVGSEAVAAVAMAFPFLMFFYATGDAIVFGASALIARYTGAGDRDAVNRASTHAIVLVSIYYLVLALALIPLMERILILFGTPSEIMALTLVYLRIQLIVLPLSEVFFVYSSILQATGDSITPMKLWTATMLANMVIDPILILGLGPFAGLGVLGAALGVAVSRLGVAAVVVSRLIQGRHGIIITRDHLQPDRTLLRAIARISLPIGGERLLMGLEQLALVAVVARFGSPVLAAYGVGGRLLSLALMPGFAAGTAVTALVGQNLGAGQVERAERGTWTSLGLVFALLSVMGMALAVFAARIIPLFNAEPEVIAYGTAHIRTIGPAMGFVGLFFVLGGAYRAVERTFPFMVMALASSWLVRIPLAVLLPRFLGVSGIWYAMVMASVLACLGATAWLKYGYWSRVGAAPRDLQSTTQSLNPS